MKKKSHIYQNQVLGTNFQLLSPLVCQYGLLGTIYFIVHFLKWFFKLAWSANDIIKRKMQ